MRNPLLPAISIGRIVNYKLTDVDVQNINWPRTAFGAAEGPLDISEGRIFPAWIV